MLDKLGIGIVGVTDYLTRLYNLGAGFAAIEGIISFGLTDSVYLGFTSERAYRVEVDGDLVISTETSGFGQKVDGVYGFDVSWSESAQVRGFAKGTVKVINPDLPDAVSTFHVVMDRVQQVLIKFGKDTDANARTVITDTTDIGKLDREMHRILAGGEPQVDSSAVRRALHDARGSDIAWADFGSRRTGDAVPDSVRRYIDDHGLYAGGDLSRFRDSILT